MFKVGLFVFTLALHASAPGAEVLRDPKGLLGWYGRPAGKEKFLRLSRAKIIHLNYELIRRDFPETKNMSDAEIEAAILNCTGYISWAQTAPNSVNTKIPLASNESIMAYRPLAYGRAAVFECFEGLIDMKGAGACIAPSQGEYGTGLFSLAQSLREELMQRVTALILEHEGYAPGTVETYGQIDLGFDVITPEGKKIPAGGLLRQAHRRDHQTGYSGAKGIEIEKILRKYGLTSEPTLIERNWHLLSNHNVQMDANGSVFDFETIYRFPNFRNSPVNPDPDLELPLAIWDEFQRVKPWADKLAQEIRGGRVDSAGVEEEMEIWLRPLREKLMSCEEALAAGRN